MASKTSPDHAPDTAANKLALAALAFAAFVVGTAELVVVGLLDLVAKNYHVTVSSAGQVVIAYALGIAIVAPILTAVTTRFGRRPVLLVALSLFVLGNALATVVTSFGLLLLARVLTGTIHGLFVGVASVIAATVVPPQRRGQAISMVFGGIAVSTVIGVPLGTLLGQAIGWRAAFGAIVVLAVLALIGAALFVPAVPNAGSTAIGAQARAALAPRVLAMLAVGLVLVGGQFTAFTYLAPFLGTITGVSGGTISAFLLAYGVAAAAGTLLGGRAADKNPNATLLTANVVLVAALAMLYAFGSQPVVTAVALAAWGLAGFALIPALQLRVIGLAGTGGDLAATLNASAVNAGIAAGSLIGGIVLASHGADGTVLVALIAVATMVPATWATRFLTAPPSRGADAAPQDAPARARSRRADLASETDSINSSPMTG